MAWCDTARQCNTKWHSTVKPWMAQCSTTQLDTALHGTAQHATAQYSMAQHSTEQHDIARHSTTQYSTAWHSIAWNSMTQHGTAWLGTAWHPSPTWALHDLQVITHNCSPYISVTGRQVTTSARPNEHGTPHEGLPGERVCSDTKNDITLVFNSVLSLWIRSNVNPLHWVNTLPMLRDVAMHSF